VTPIDLRPTVANQVFKSNRFPARAGGLWKPRLVDLSSVPGPILPDAWAHSQLGRIDEAKAALAELLRLAPDATATPTTAQVLEAARGYQTLYRRSKAGGAERQLIWRIEDKEASKFQALGSRGGGAAGRVMSASGRLWCKSRKLQGDEFFAKTRNGKQSPIRITSVALLKSPVSLTCGDEVPHISTRKPRLRPAEFLITSAKRLLQHNRPRASNAPSSGMSAIG
jgi:hypothetical protein